MSGSTGKGELIYGLALTSISSCLFVGVLKFLGWVGGPMYHVCSSLGLALRAKGFLHVSCNKLRRFMNYSTKLL